MGQSKKLRPCPAAGRDITAAECGENRHHRYACPATCPFDPFAAANYTGLLATEDVLDHALLKRLVAEDPGAPARIDAARRANAGHGWHAAVAWQLFFKRDEQGRTLVERWKQVGQGGLKNDERILLGGKAQMRVALIEMHRVIDAERFEVVDLLEEGGAPMVFADRSAGARATRFATVLTWVYPLPHFWRMSGTGIVLDDVTPLPALEALEACLAHLGAPAGRVGQRRWLAENFCRIDEVLTASGLERRRQMLAAIDATWVAATYTLQVSPAAARAVLHQEVGIADEELSPEEETQGFTEARVWLDHRPSASQGLADAGEGRVVLGRVLLGPKEWRIEAIGQERSRRLRAAFEARLGARVAFSRERRDDLGGRMAAKDPAPDLALVPPRLLENPTSFELSSSRVAAPAPGVSLQDHQAAIARKYFRTWVDEKIPALGGRSPRAAVRDPAWRGKVIELMKGQVRQIDQANLESGRNDDANFVIRELGLSEIDFPPPPPRPRQPKAGGSPRDQPPGASEDSEFEPRPAPSPALRPPAPRLEGAPLTLEAARQRLTRAARGFDLAADAAAELAASGATLVDDLTALTRGRLKENEFGFMLAHAYPVWFTLVPVGVRAPSLDFSVMEAGNRALFERLRPGGPVGTGIYAALQEGSRQPGLLNAICQLMVSGALQLPKEANVARESVLLMAVALRVLLDELDRVLRLPPAGTQPRPPAE